MRKISLIIILSLLYIFCFSQNPKDTNEVKEAIKIDLSYDDSEIPLFDSLAKEYKVTKIKRLNNAFLISLKDSENYRYTLMSLKCKKLKSQKIKVGKVYSFVLYSFYGNNIIISDPMVQRFLIDGQYITFKVDFSTFVVTTSNLNGLYYIKSEIKINNDKLPSKIQ